MARQGGRRGAGPGSARRLRKRERAAVLAARATLRLNESGCVRTHLPPGERSGRVLPDAPVRRHDPGELPPCPGHAGASGGARPPEHLTCPARPAPAAARCAFPLPWRTDCLRSAPVPAARGERTGHGPLRPAAGRADLQELVQPGPARDAASRPPVRAETGAAATPCRISRGLRPRFMS